MKLHRVKGSILLISISILISTANNSFARPLVGVEQDNRSATKAHLMQQQQIAEAVQQGDVGYRLLFIHRSQ